MKHIEIYGTYDQASVQAALTFLFAQRKEQLSGNTVKDLERVAFLSFIGAYDTIIRSAPKKRSDLYDQHVQALRVIRTCGATLERMGCLCFGTTTAESVVKEVGVRTRLANAPTHVHVARVTESEAGWGTRPDGWVWAIEEADHKVLLKSTNGNHLWGDDREFSYCGEFVIKKLTDAGKLHVQSFLDKGLRAEWLHEIKEYIE